MAAPETRRTQLTAQDIVRQTAILAAASAAFALFFPSSRDGSISTAFGVALVLVPAALAFLIGAINWREAIGVVLAFVMVAILVIATMASPLEGLTPGAIFPYALLMSVLTVGLVRQGPPPAWLVRVFLVLSVALVLFGLLVAFGVEQAIEINESWYQAFYDELFQQMVLWQHKPVTVFASHSVAAFAYFAFLATHVRLVATASAGVRRVSWLCILGYLALLVLLTSFTGFALFVVSIGWISYAAWPGRRVLRTAVVGLTLAGVGAFAVSKVDQDVLEFVRGAFTSEGNGLLGRYTSGGRLEGTYAYIAAHPFRPIGLTIDRAQSVLSLGDNAIAEYIVRGSLPLYAAVLLASFLFWRRNLVRRQDAWAFFLFVLASDVAFPLLTYPRFMGIVFLLVLVWNRCAELEVRTRPAHQGA